MPFSSHYIKNTRHQYNLSLLIVTLITWMREWLSDFSTVNILPSLFPYGALWREVSKCRPHLRVGKFCSISFKANILGLFHFHINVRIKLKMSTKKPPEHSDFNYDSFEFIGKLGELTSQLYWVFDSMTATSFHLLWFFKIPLISVLWF